MEENQITTGQRSKMWFEKRHKRWSASVISKLMSEGAKVPKNAGGDGELVWKWGGAAKTAIFSKFMERLTDIIAKETPTTPEMQRGLDLEPLAIERFGELYMDYICIDSEKLVETGFILFPDDDGTREWEDGYKGENSSAGASPDQILLKQSISEKKENFEIHADLGFKNVVSGIETKARGDEATHSHAYSLFDEKHDDFWQVQCQMHAVGAKYWYYLNFDDEKPSNWQLAVKKVPISPIHIQKMCTKIKDADALIADYITRCDGIEAMMPDERSVLLTGIREEIQGLKDKW